MAKVIASETIELGLSATIQLQQTGITIECITQYIASDFSDIIVITSDPRVDTEEVVTLSMVLPLERSPVKCTGKIGAVSASTGQIKNFSGYLVRVIINHINRIDKRRLELAIIRRKAFIGSGRGLSLQNMTRPTAGVAEPLRVNKKNGEDIAAEVRSLKESMTQLQETVKNQNAQLKKTNKLDTHNILIVDDEVANLNALERTLKGLKRTLKDEYSIFLATNGKDALSIMERNDIGFIIADQRMPGMTGIEFLEKTLDEHPDAIRIMLTAYTDEGLLMDAINKVHVHGYISKPWEPEEIATIIQAGIGNQEIAHSHMSKGFHKAGLSPG